MPFSTTLQGDSESVSKFVKNVSLQNKNSAKQYHSRLLFFESFAKDYYNNNNNNNNKSNNNIDKLIQHVKESSDLQ